MMSTIFGVIAVLSGATGLYTLLADMPKFNKACWIICGVSLILSIAL